MEGLVDRDHQPGRARRFRIARALDLLHERDGEAPVVDDQMRQKDHGGCDQRRPDSELDSDPDQGRQEAERVGEQMREKGPPCLRVPSDLYFLPPASRFEKEVARHVADEKSEEDLTPVHGIAPSVRLTGSHP